MKDARTLLFNASKLNARNEDMTRGRIPAEPEDVWVDIVDTDKRGFVQITHGAAGELTSWVKRGKTSLGNGDVEASEIVTRHRTEINAITLFMRGRYDESKNAYEIAMEKSMTKDAFYAAINDAIDNMLSHRRGRAITGWMNK